MEDQLIMSLLRRIDSEIERRSLLKHPFYQMWSRGELTMPDLKAYSMEYFQLVKAVPSFLRNTVALAPDSMKKAAISRNLAEEREHIQPWVRFAGAVGVNERALRSYTAPAPTTEAISDLEAITSSSFEEAVAALYAYEKQLPEISKSKIEGLRRFYGLDSIEARRYFEIHEEADVRHANLWRRILANLPSIDEREAFLAAVQSLKAQNKLLDSVLAKIKAE
jgi:pyrroloquinoline-quinone synthase